MRNQDIGDVIENNQNCGIVPDSHIVMRTVDESRDLTSTALAGLCAMP